MVCALAGIEGCKMLFCISEGLVKMKLIETSLKCFPNRARGENTLAIPSFEIPMPVVMLGCIPSFEVTVTVVVMFVLTA